MSLKRQHPRLSHKASCFKVGHDFTPEDGHSCPSIVASANERDRSVPTPERATRGHRDDIPSPQIERPLHSIFEVVFLRDAARASASILYRRRPGVIVFVVKVARCLARVPINTTLIRRGTAAKAPQGHDTRSYGPDLAGSMTTFAITPTAASASEGPTLNFQPPRLYPSISCAKVVTRSL